MELRTSLVHDAILPLSEKIRLSALAHFLAVTSALVSNLNIFQVTPVRDTS